MKPTWSRICYAIQFIEDNPEPLSMVTEIYLDESQAKERAQELNSINFKPHDWLTNGKCEVIELPLNLPLKDSLLEVDSEQVLSGNSLEQVP